MSSDLRHQLVDFLKLYFYIGRCQKISSLPLGRLLISYLDQISAFPLVYFWPFFKRIVRPQNVSIYAGCFKKIVQSLFAKWKKHQKKKWSILQRSQQRKKGGKISVYCWKVFELLKKTSKIKNWNSKICTINYFYKYFLHDHFVCFVAISSIFSYGAVFMEKFAKRFLYNFFFKQRLRLSINSIHFYHLHC